MCFVPLRHFMGHSHIPGNIALVYNLSIQHLRHKSVTQCQKQGNGANGYGNLLKYGVFCLHSVVIVSQVRLQSVAGVHFFFDLRRFLSPVAD